MNEKKGYSCMFMWSNSKWRERTMWKILMKDVDLGEPTSFLGHVYLGCTHENVKQAKILWIITGACSNPESLLERLKSNQVQGNLTRTFPHGPMTWKAMQRNAWKDFSNWRTKQLNSYTAKSQHHALTTTNSRKKKWDLLEKCQKFAHRLF